LHKKQLVFVLLWFFVLMAIPSAAQAATITSCTLDKTVYVQGQTGYVTVTIYNDEDNKIRVTELTAQIDYYYTDGTVYLQKFFTNVTLPIEIQQGLSNTLYIPFSLPTNMAPGYTKLTVEAKTDEWNPQTERWTTSDHPTNQPRIYVESPYKQQYETQADTNKNLTNMTYLFATTTVLFAAVAALLTYFYKRPRPLPQP